MYMYIFIYLYILIYIGINYEVDVILRTATLGGFATQVLLLSKGYEICKKRIYEIILIRFSK